MTPRDNERMPLKLESRRGKRRQAARQGDGQRRWRYGCRMGKASAGAFSSVRVNVHCQAPFDHVENCLTQRVALSPERSLFKRLWTR